MLISPNIPCTARFACKRPSIGEEAAIPAACSALKSQSFHLLSSCDRLSWHTTIRQQCPVSLSLSLALICSTCIHSNPLYTLVPAHIQWFQCIDPSSCHWIVSRTCAFHDLRGWTNRWDLLLEVGPQGDKWPAGADMTRVARVVEVWARYGPVSKCKWKKKKKHVA